jgi:membrane protein YqaA with SNARE-associated domain
LESFFEYGLWGLFFASLLAATVLPFSSEALLALMVAANYDKFEVLWIATAGNFLGGMSCYFLGFLGKREWIEKFLRMKPETIAKSRKYLDKYGSFSAFMTWVPFVGDPLAVALGLVRSNIFFVSVFMFMGKMLRYVALIYLVDLF